MKEIICDVRWEGPFLWGDRFQGIKPAHALYALYGTHHLYGQNKLLYLGRTEVDLGARLSGHAKWVQGEYDPMQIRIASVGSFPSIEAWWEAWDAQKKYEKADAELVARIEALLIYARIPNYLDQPFRSSVTSHSD